MYSIRIYEKRRYVYACYIYIYIFIDVQICKYVSTHILVKTKMQVCIYDYMYTCTVMYIYICMWGDHIARPPPHDPPVGGAWGGGG